MKYIDSLIRKKGTGNLHNLAKKLNLSRSHTMRLLKEMREEGFPIEYSKEKGSYYYSKDGKIVPSLFTQEMSTKEMRQITGGKTFFQIFPDSKNKNESQSLEGRTAFTQSYYMRL